MTSCLGTTTEAPETRVDAISVAEAARLHGRPNVVFVDPRPAIIISTTTGIIPGAHNIGVADIQAGNLPPEFSDADVHIVTSCQAGPMGKKAAQAFVERGFTLVNFVDGGTQAWVDAGYTTDR